MKILIVGNLPEDKQESMLRFERMLAEGLRQRGHEVLQCAPRLRAARLLPGYRYGGLGKYLGYWDKFVLFPRELRRLVAGARPDIVHIVDHANAGYASVLPRRSLATVHDLQQIRAARGEIPQQRVGLAGRRYQAWILSRISRLQTAVCVSDNTARDLRRLAGLEAGAVRVIPNALNDVFAPMPAAQARALLASFVASKGGRAPEGAFLLNVGGGQWYKNRPGLLRIYAALRTRVPEQPALVMVGKPLSPADESLAASLGLTPHLLLLSGVPNPVLNALYSLAEGLLFPSFEEGFGWPLAEAQACGCPVFTSRRPPMSDIAGPHSVLFDPLKPEEAAAALVAAWPHRRELAQRALPTALRWAPETLFKAYEACYQDMLLPAPAR